MAVAPGSIHLVEDEDDVAALPDVDGPVALLAQTTLSHHDWAGVLAAAEQRFPDLWMPGRSDLCFATTNRQSALTQIAAHCDAVLVIGSANSSNTVALEKVARATGCPRVHRVNHAGEVPDDLHGTVGVTAGASAPEELVEAVIARLAPRARAGGGRLHRRGRVLPAAPGAARAAHRRRRGGLVRPRARHAPSDRLTGSCRPAPSWPRWGPEPGP